MLRPQKAFSAACFTKLPLSAEAGAMTIVNQLRLLARLHAKAAESFDVFGPDLIALVFGFAGREANIEI
jgi:hypothetical protein